MIFFLNILHQWKVIDVDIIEDLNMVFVRQCEEVTVKNSIIYK